MKPAFPSSGYIVSTRFRGWQGGTRIFQVEVTLVNSPSRFGKQALSNFELGGAVVSFTSSSSGTWILWLKAKALVVPKFQSNTRKLVFGTMKAWGWMVPSWLSCSNFAFSFIITSPGFAGALGIFGVGIGMGIGLMDEPIIEFAKESSLFSFLN